MESVLQHRDRVGVPDAILLEDFLNQDAFVDNLKKRYQHNIIYTYIGHVLVTVNPYQDFGLYTETLLEKYRNGNFYELPPHVYAIAENAYRMMTSENLDQCILISGESGAGKTEASKQVLHCVAASSLHRKAGDHVRDRLLQSTPLLEAFGNAKTNKNDNSSRFGKYMDVECNFKGDPLGGHILNYLLEKSRVVHQERGERNFHIFYQLLKGASQKLLTNLKLERDLSLYNFLRQDSADDLLINDVEEFTATEEALKVTGFSGTQQTALWHLVAGILHLGNVTFQEDDFGNAVIKDLQHIEFASEMLCSDFDGICGALTKRTIEAKGDAVISPLTPEQAYYVRDALAKAVYSRLFDWLVGQLNVSLQNQERTRKSLLGILDIYGFEIFQNNGFEQFCINFCNEKLQQVFIELTLRSEQEEYEREGIEWQKVEYFDNKIICNLIEERHKGIISILDEECLRPGDASDMTFLSKMDDLLQNHNHYVSYNSLKSNIEKKSIDRHEFRLRHYAGDVSYSVKGFMDKNNDLLFRDLKASMAQSTHQIVQQIFSMNELTELKHPVTASTQFKFGLSQLTDILMSKQPSYIRCIKPNDIKTANNFDENRVRHQVQYLGLMENLRVRRAGFAYRRNYEVFLQRYKSLCPATWPNHSGSPKRGVELILQHLDYSPDDYKMGQTKLFIRLPKTLFDTEDAFQYRKNELAALLQATYKCVRQRRIYIRQREAAITIEKYWRSWLARRLAKRRRRAVQVLKSFVKGFITRNNAPNPTNAKFQQIVKREWLLRLKAQLPKSFMTHKWPPAPLPCIEASELLQKLHLRWLVTNYVKTITPTKKIKFEEKLLAEKIFKDKKASYPTSIGYWFHESRLNNDEENLRKTAFEQAIKPQGEITKYCISCIKLDRHGYRQRPRILFLTTLALYLLEAKDNRLVQKHRFTFQQIQAIVVSSNSDELLLLQITNENPKTDKGDLLVIVDNVIETVTKIVSVTKEANSVRIIQENSFHHTLKNGKQKPIQLNTGTVASINKGKDGSLQVVAKLAA